MPYTLSIVTYFYCTRHLCPSILSRKTLMEVSMQNEKCCSIPIHINLFICLSADMNADDISAAHLGCFAEQETDRDLPYQIWTRSSDASVTSCMYDCNAQGFAFAGLQVNIQGLIFYQQNNNLEICYISYIYGSPKYNQNNIRWVLVF